MDIRGVTPLTNQVTWQASLAPSGVEDYGIYWQVPMEQRTEAPNDIIHKGGYKMPGT